MSSRGKRKFDIDPNASDPDDYDYDDADRRAAPQRRRHQRTPGAKKRPPKRPRRAYGGSDIDDDDEFASDDSFTERSESEPPEINPATGRSTRPPSPTTRPTPPLAVAPSHPSRRSPGRRSSSA